MNKEILIFGCSVSILNDLKLTIKQKEIIKKIITHPINTLKKVIIIVKIKSKKLIKLKLMNFQ